MLGEDGGSEPEERKHECHLWIFASALMPEQNKLALRKDFMNSFGKLN